MDGVVGRWLDPSIQSANAGRWSQGLEALVEHVSVAHGHILRFAVVILRTRHAGST
jgi:hypothetical protein